MFPIKGASDRNGTETKEGWKGSPFGAVKKCMHPLMSRDYLRLRGLNVFFTEVSSLQTGKKIFSFYHCNLITMKLNELSRNWNTLQKVRTYAVKQRTSTASKKWGRCGKDKYRRETSIQLRKNRKLKYMKLVTMSSFLHKWRKNLGNLHAFL